MKVNLNIEELDNAIIEFTNEDVWNLDSILAKIIHAGLVEFRKVATNSTPILLDNNEDWLATLDSMIKAFSLISDDIFSYELNKEEVDSGLQKFATNFKYLWT